MVGKSFVILLLLYFSLADYSASSQKIKKKTLDKIPDFDGLVLAQQWKRSSCCSINNLSNPLPNCQQCDLTDIASDWTIHGLWPTDSTNRNNQVSDCPNPVKGPNPFASYSKDLYDAMDHCWPNSKHFATKEAFWWYQWTKHGTCAIELPETQNHVDYFRKTINLYNTYQVGDMLEKERIVPKNSYSIDAIYNGLRNRMANYEPTIKCLKKEDNTYLMEVYMCFTKQFTLRNCNTKSIYCNNNNVYYP